MNTRPYLRRRSLASSCWFGGHLVTALATSEETGGALALLEMQSAPGMEPPAHRHAREAEGIFVLDGALEGYSGSRPISVQSGEFANFPRGEVHAWKLHPGSDGASAHGLVVFVPGGMERFFHQHAEPATSLTTPPVTDSGYGARLQARLPAMAATLAELEITHLPSDYAPSLEAESAEPLPCMNVLGELFRPLALAAQTAGLYTALEWTSPVGSQLPKHCHQDADEIFYILEGAVSITAEDGFSVIAEPGDFVFLPKGIGHTHRATNGKPSRAFQLLTPGGIENGLARVAQLAPAEVTLERLVELSASVNLTLLPE